MKKLGAMTAGVVLLLAGTPAVAQSPNVWPPVAAPPPAKAVTDPSAKDKEARDWVLRQLRHRVREGVVTDKLANSLMDRFYRSDLDGGGVGQSDRHLEQQQREVSARAAKMMTWLRQDLNGDGVVTRAELSQLFTMQARRSMRHRGVLLQPTPEQIAKVRDKLMGDALKADADGDGRITFAEAVNHARQTAVVNRYRGSSVLIPEAFDRDNNGIITEAEFRTVVDQVIKGFDGNGDGRLSADEVRSFKDREKSARRAELERKRARKQEEKARLQASQCGLPAASAKASVVLIGAYEGLALSNASLGGDDKVVQVANLVIEPGDAPLYVVATSFNAMIWQVSGAVARIERIVVQSATANAAGVPRAGVTGVAADRVAFVRKPDCLPYFSRWPEPRARAASDMLRHALGRAPGPGFGVYGAGTVSVPSMRHDARKALPNLLTMPQDGPGAPLWREVLRFNPGGLANIRPRDVVAPVKVARYEVLPQEAGLAQLLEVGVLEPRGTGSVPALGDGAKSGSGAKTGIAPRSDIGRAAQIRRTTREFRITGKMRFPADLCGAHSVQFILGNGVEMPKGPACHSSVMSEATGAMLCERGQCQ